MQDTNVSSDPSILCLAITSEAEKFATVLKALASEVFKEGKEADGSSCHQQKAEAQPKPAVGVEGVEDTEEWKGGVEDTRKNDETVECSDASFNSESEDIDFQIDYSDSDNSQTNEAENNPLPSVEYPRTNDESFELFRTPFVTPSTTPSPTASSARGVGTPWKKGDLILEIDSSSSEEIEVDQQVISRQDSTPRAGKQLGESSPPHSATSNSTKDYPQKSICPLRSQATIPHYPSPLPRDEISSNEAEAEENNAAVGVEDTEEMKGGVDTRQNDETVECSDASFNSESEESVFQLDYSDSDSASELSFPD